MLPARSSRHRRWTASLCLNQPPSPWVDLDSLVLVGKDARRAFEHVVTKFIGQPPLCEPAFAEMWDCECLFGRMPAVKLHHPAHAISRRRVCALCPLRTVAPIVGGHGQIGDSTSEMLVRIWNVRIFYTSIIAIKCGAIISTILDTRCNPLFLFCLVPIADGRYVAHLITWNGDGTQVSGFFTLGVNVGNHR